MAKKVRFLKNHGRHVAGEEASVLDDAANYYIRCSVAEEVTEEESKAKAATKKAATKKK